MSARKAVVLLSGGLDSATSAAQAIADGYELIALSLHYGQRHDRELIAAKRVAEHLGINAHFLVDVGSVLDMGMGCPESFVGLNPAIQIPMSSAPPWT